MLIGLRTGLRSALGSTAQAICRWLLLAALLMLTACSTLDPKAVPGLPSNLPTGSPTGFPPYQSNIDLQGRMSVMYQQRGKDEALHGKFEWHQKQDEIAITLRSPVGETLAQIFVTPAGARIRQAGAPEREAADMDTLMAQTLGWPLPVAGLRYWLQGQVPGATPLQDDMTESQGWRIRFVSRHPDGSPKRIDLARYSTEAGEVKLRLIIDGLQ